jgi:hypothetical protein
LSAMNHHGRGGTQNCNSLRSTIEEGTPKKIASHLTRRRRREGHQVRQWYGGGGERDGARPMTKKKGLAKVATWLDFKYVENVLLGTVGEHEFFLLKRFMNFLNLAFGELIFQKLMEML